MPGSSVMVILKGQTTDHQKNIIMKKLLKYFLYLVFIAGITIGALELFSTYTPSTTIHTLAPVTTRHTILINAPAEKVWRVLGV